MPRIQGFLCRFACALPVVVIGLLSASSQSTTASSNTDETETRSAASRDVAHHSEPGTVPSSMPCDRLVKQEGGYEDGYDEEGYDEYGEPYSEEESGYYDEEGEYGTPRPQVSSIRPVDRIVALPAPGPRSKAIALGRFTIDTRTRQVSRRILVEDPEPLTGEDESSSEVSGEDSEDADADDGSDEYEDEDDSDGGYDDGEPSGDDYDTGYDEDGYYEDEYESGPRYETITETVTEEVPWKLTLLGTGAPPFKRRGENRGGYDSDDGYDSEEDAYYDSDEDDYYDSEGESDYDSSEEGYDEGEGYYDEEYGGPSDKTSASDEDEHAATFSDQFELLALETPSGAIAWKLFSLASAQPVDVAHLWRSAGGVLTFQWTPEATPAHASALGYHVLVLETGKETQPFGFSKIAPAQGLRVSCSQRRGVCRFMVPGLPKEARLCLEVSGLRGFAEIHAQPSGAVPMGTTVTVSVPTGEAGRPTAVLQLQLQQEPSGAVAVHAAVANAVAEQFTVFVSAGVPSERLPLVRDNMLKRIEEIEEQLEKAVNPPAEVRQRLMQDVATFQTKVSLINVIMAVHNTTGISYRVAIDAGGYAVPVAAHEASPAAKPAAAEDAPRETAR